MTPHPFDTYKPGDTFGWDLMNENFVQHLSARGMWVFKVGYGEWEIYADKNKPGRAHTYKSNCTRLSTAIERERHGEKTWEDMPALRKLVFDEPEPVMIRLVNIKSLPGAPHDLYIGRANEALGLPESKWHNPFVLRHERDRDAILAQYRDYVLGSPELIAALPELSAKRLGCYCYPKRCHGNVLIDIYNLFHPAA